MIRNILLAFLLTLNFIYAEQTIADKVIEKVKALENSEAKEEVKKEDLPKSDFALQIKSLKKTRLKGDDLFIRRFKISMEIEKMLAEKKKLEKKLSYARSSSQRVSLTVNLDAITSQIKSLQETKKNLDNILKIQTPQLLDEVNIINYITGSYKKRSNQYEQKFIKLKKDYAFSLAKTEALKNALLVLRSEDRTKDEIAEIDKLLEDIDLDLKYLKLTKDIIDKQKIKIDSFTNEIKHKLDDYENYELRKIIIFISLFVSLLLTLYAIRRAQEKYIADEDKRMKARKYTTNMIASVVVISLFLMASDNFGKLVTILGFMGGGMIISAKEEVLNFVAWLQIMFSNYLHPGDRIAIKNGNELIVGDIIDIGMNRITLFERMTEGDITYEHTGKAGRIIHFQNNIIFSPSTRVYIYNHEILNTVYDFLELDIPRHVDFNDTRNIVTNTVTELTARYAEAMNTQIGQISKQYHIKKFEMKPNSYFQITPDRKIKLYVWFPTPEKDIMTMKNILSLQIYKRLLESGIDLLAPNRPYEWPEKQFNEIKVENIQRELEEANKVAQNSTKNNG